MVYICTHMGQNKLIEIRNLPWLIKPQGKVVSGTNDGSGESKKDDDGDDGDGDGDGEVISWCKMLSFWGWWGSISKRVRLITHTTI